MSTLDEVIERRRSEGATALPPDFETIKRRASRRAGGRRASAGAGLVGVAVLTGLLVTGGIDRTTGTNRIGSPTGTAFNVPAEISGAIDLPFTLPQDSALPYRFEATTSTVSAFAVETRTVILRPLDLSKAPTAQICVQAAGAAGSCLRQGVHLVRLVDGRLVVITLSGPGAGEAAKYWTQVALGTSYEQNVIFAPRPRTDAPESGTGN